MEVSTAQSTADDDVTENHTPSTLVRGRLSAEDFVLAETFTAVRDLTVESTPVAATGMEARMSLLWAQTDDDNVTATLAHDPSVSAIEKLWRTDDRQLYRVEWSHDSYCRMGILLQSQGLLLSSQGNNAQWQLDLLYPNRETLRQATECCERFGLSLTIDSIRSCGPDQRSQYGLTQVQQETLAHAQQQGYFQVPRAICLDELAEQLGISHQALSERLRRGHDTLINAMLLGSQSTVPTVPPTASFL